MEAIYVDHRHILAAVRTEADRNDARAALAEYTSLRKHLSQLTVLPNASKARAALVAAGIDCRDEDSFNQIFCSRSPISQDELDRHVGIIGQQIEDRLRERLEVVIRRLQAAALEDLKSRRPVVSDKDQETVLRYQLPATALRSPLANIVDRSIESTAAALAAAFEMPHHFDKAQAFSWLFE